jgi:hypothetical protein
MIPSLLAWNRKSCQELMPDPLDPPQRVIAYWEREAVSLRPEQVQALADALNISADDLLGRKATKARGNGPVGRAKKLFDSISQLPRHQQEKIISILEPFVREHVAANGAH